MKNLFSIKNKIIIITGGGRGIGKFLATGMGKEGAIVYCIDKEFEKKDTKIKTVFQEKCDITNAKKFQNICKKIFLRHKKIDVLINNAGITIPELKNKIYPKKKWEETININLTACLDSSQAVLEFMSKKKSGSIINITSINAELGFPNNPAYVASKGGLKMLGKALARDWGKYGIRINNLGPGYIKTDMVMKSYKNKKAKRVRESQTMMKRWGTIKDLLGPCIFLASDASNYITGQDIYVDGGWTANGLPY